MLYFLLKRILAVVLLVLFDYRDIENDVTKANEKKGMVSLIEMKHLMGKWLFQ